MWSPSWFLFLFDYLHFCPLSGRNSGMIGVRHDFRKTDEATCREPWARSPWRRKWPPPCRWPLWCTAVDRSSEPYIIITANVLIDKKIFVSINEDLTNFYGEDLLLSWNLKKLNLQVIHIDNPVFHLGLENSVDFMNKAKTAITNLVRLEKEGRIGHDFISLQRAYRKLKRYGGLGLFRSITKMMGNRMRSNALSDSPSMFYFNLWRLSHYTNLKKNDWILRRHSSI